MPLGNPFACGNPAWRSLLSDVAPIKIPESTMLYAAWGTPSRYLSPLCYTTLGGAGFLIVSEFRSPRRQYIVCPASVAIPLSSSASS